MSMSFPNQNSSLPRHPQPNPQSTAQHTTGQLLTPPPHLSIYNLEVLWESGWGVPTFQQSLSHHTSLWQAIPRSLYNMSDLNPCHESNCGHLIGTQEATGPGVRALSFARGCCLQLHKQRTAQHQCHFTLPSYAGSLLQCFWHMSSRVNLGLTAQSVPVPLPGRGQSPPQHTKALLSLGSRVLEPQSKGSLSAASSHIHN